MPELKVVSIKGHIREYGPKLEHAPHIIYIGRVNRRGRAHGGWDLDQSPFHNLWSEKRAGSLETAVHLYAAHLIRHPEIVEQARVEVDRVRGLAEEDERFTADDVAFGCWGCAETGVCHGVRLIEAIERTGLWAPEPAVEYGRVLFGNTLRGRDVATVKLQTGAALL